MLVGPVQAAQRPQRAAVLCIAADVRTIVVGEEDPSEEGSMVVAARHVGMWVRWVEDVSTTVDVQGHLHACWPMVDACWRTVVRTTVRVREPLSHDCPS